MWTESRIDKCLDAAAAGYAAWSACSLDDRLQGLQLLKNALTICLEDLSRLISLEIGKPITQSRAEVNKSISLIDYYQKHAQEILAGRKIKVNKYKKARVKYDPQGIVLGVMPWNFPVWQVLRFAIPVITGGNVVVVKQAQNAGQTAQYLDNIFKNVFPDMPIFQSIFIGHHHIDQVLRSPQVIGVSVTGSEQAGIAVAGAAAKYLKKSVLELGGSDPFIVLKDANIKKAAAAAVAARMNNNGQTCIAAKRFIIEKDIYKDFIDAFIDSIQNYKYGSPGDEDAQMTVLARADLAKSLELKVKKSIKAGATLLLSGGIDKKLPACYLPQILTNIPMNSPAYNEELFGPVATIFQAKDMYAAIGIANHSRFGLGASVWTRDKSKATEVCNRLESGSVAVNAQLSSDPHIPFGGVKASGYGREMSAEGLIEFLNTKSIIFTKNK